MSLLLLAAILLASPEAAATQVGTRSVPCPIGGDPVAIHEKISSDTLGGYDSDLATYASKGQFRRYAISTCSGNLLSMYGKDMTRALTGDETAKVTAALASARSDLGVTDAATLEPWEQYQLAGRVYEALGRDAMFLAQLYLEASWTARDAAVGVYMGLQGPAAARTLLTQGATEVARRDLSLAQRKTLLYNLARVAHRAGYGAERDAWLDAFAAAGALDEAERAALARFRRVATEIEPGLQDLAIHQLQLALRREGIAMDDKVRSTYTLADLLRRRGRTREAMALFTLVANEQSAPDELREMALYLASELAG